MGRERKYEVSTYNAYDEWGKDFPMVKTWLTHLAKKDLSAWNLWYFCRYVNKTPEQLLDLKKDPASKEAERLLDQFVTDETIKESIRFSVSVSVKSFFKWNYRELARACGLIEVTKKKPYKRHSKEELRKIRDAARNPRDRALISFTWSTAIAKESLSRIQMCDLEPDWRNQEIPSISLTSEKIKGKGRGKYKGVEQHTFLTPEAKADLISYIDWMQRIRNVAFKPEDYLWRDVNTPFGPMTYETLSKIAHNLSNWSGVPFGWHDARRYVETALEEVKISPNWARKIRGRKVKGEEAPYSRPAIEQLRAKYKEAVGLLQFTQVEDLAEIRKRQETVERLQLKILTGERLDAQDRADISKYQIKFGKKRYPLKQPEGADASEDDDCEAEFRQVHEADLIEHLRNGWKIEYKLASGEVIVKRLQ